jgi:hypothetical protein
MFTRGFRDYIESTEPVREAVPLGELIRGNRPAVFEHQTGGSQPSDFETREPALKSDV